MSGHLKARTSREGNETYWRLQACPWRALYTSKSEFAPAPPLASLDHSTSSSCQCPFTSQFLTVLLGPLPELDLLHSAKPLCDSSNKHPRGLIRVKLICGISPSVLPNDLVVSGVVSRVELVESSLLILNCGDESQCFRLTSIVSILFGFDYWLEEDSKRSPFSISTRLSRLSSKIVCLPTIVIMAHTSWC